MFVGYTDGSSGVLATAALDGELALPGLQGEVGIERDGNGTVTVRIRGASTVYESGRVLPIDALREANLANPIVHVEDGVDAMDYLLRRLTQLLFPWYEGAKA